MARILLTEDDEAVRSFVSRALSLDGHTLKSAADGEQALQHISEGEGNFDLLLSDIKMPVMDGIDLAVNVSARWPNICILLMTGFAEQSEKAEGLYQIVHDVVGKPFTLVELRRAVSNALINTEVQSPAQLPSRNLS